MNIKDCLSDSYTTVHHEMGVSSIKSDLLNNQYLVVVDDNEDYVGILSISDLIKRPHNLVIDCLSEKQIISPDDSMSTVVEKFHKSRCFALPLYENGVFAGVIEKNCIMNKLKIRLDELQQNSVISQNLKKNFLRNVSHEIRTPMNILVNFLDVISEIDIDKFRDESKKYRTMLKHNIDSFLVMMNDLIDLSRIDSGEVFPCELGSVDITSLFNDFKDYFETRSKIINQNLKISFSIEQGCENIVTDYKKLKQILYNLIDNAIKFATDENVECSCRIDKSSSKKSSCTFYVKNNGVDINKKHNGDIFAAFSKGGDQSGEYTTGLGIGLSLSKKLSEILRGELNFESKSGQTTFFLKLQDALK